MSEAALRHEVNGWLASVLGTPRPQRSRSVKVPSQYEEDEEDDLATAAQSVTRTTMAALQKQIRSAGFKGAEVSGWGKGQSGGFTVHYQGQQYDFAIDEANMQRNESTDYPDQDAFIRELQGCFGPEVSERQVHYRMRAGALHITYVNLPRGTGGAGGGAEAQNNRMSFDVDGFPSTTYRAMWGGKLKIEQSTTFDRSRKLRARTASPSAIAQYLAAYLNKFAVEVPPRLTHSGAHRQNGGIDWERAATQEDIERDFADTSMAGEHPDTEAHFEHDQWWVTCLCGASWSVVDSSRGLDYERIDEGDEDYHYTSNGRGTTSYRLRRIKTCANCGHHKSAHRYDPSKPRSGPQHCDIPGCRCAEFRQPAEGERVQRHESNGRRTGILSDGTRVNVYSDESTPTDQWTAVPHSEAWDSMARGKMREMLGISKHGSGSQWTEGQEGRHLGQPIPWDHVPDEIKRHIEQRVVSETMVANARGSTVDAHAARELSLYIENEYALIGEKDSPGKAIDANLRRKLAAGKYDSALAPKAWQYLIDQGAKRYQKVHGTDSPIFSAATRRQVAADFARAWEAENLTGAAGRS